ncbi:MAG TPA: G1 family glutamic endopeptidase [Terriglobales bacterium]
MQNQNWRMFNRAIAVATVTVLVASFTTLAAAQRLSGEERSAVFASAPRIQTSVKGVSVVAGPPKGFNALTASNRELLSYGLPQRPDKALDEKAYEHWEKGMMALQACSQRVQVQGKSTSPASQACQATDVTAKPYSSRSMASSGAPTANVDGTTAYTSLNWSGIAQTNKLKAWNAKTSFTEVESVWNVPVSNHPFGNIPCADGPWFNVTWNGIDGFFGAANGDVVQGGSANYWDGGGCDGSIETFGWVEWFPSYSILEINAFVSPGDDFWVISYGAEGKAEQFVFVEDITQQWSGTFGLTYQSGPGVIGGSAEYIVERPCCNGDNYYPLGNYVYEFFDYSFAYDGNGTLFYPGNTGAATAIITMQADEAADYQVISYPFWYGTAGNQGRYSIWFADSNCAYSGGCAP